VLLKTSVWVTPYATFEKGGLLALPFSLSASLLTVFAQIRQNREIVV
jgi:hypothetical protein